MFNITNKKINTSMISNARRIISSLTLNANESKNKINNKQLKYDTDTDADTYDYNNMNDITNYMKQNKNKKYAFVLCGVGDFICIDYFLNFKDIHFIFVSKSSLLLKTLLMKTEKNDKSYIQHFAVYFNFDILNRPGFNDVNEMFERLPYLKLLNKISQIHVVDINLFKRIQNIINHKPIIEALNKNNRFLNKTYCDVKKKFNLPDNIILICPYTQDNRVNCILCNRSHTEEHNCIATRNFTINDYYNTESILKSNKLTGVIVTDVQNILPDEIKDSFINLSGKTSIEESIEILKVCDGYIGIDSFLSIIATKIFANNNVIIKCYNKHAYEWKGIYWYPLTTPQLTISKNSHLDVNINPSVKYNTITIKTVQGVGDVFWVYQKLYNHFDIINLIICVVDLNCPVQKRVLPFLKLLPKVKYLKLELVTSNYYDNLAKIKKTIPELLDEWNNNKSAVFEYAVNKWLEDGVRIDQIDSYSILDNVYLINKHVYIPYNTKEYITLYISGNKISQEWQPEKYSKLIHNTFLKNKIKYPIILLGAEYDKKHLLIAGNELINYGYDVYYFIEKPFENVIYVIKNSKYFIGYQSGLSILADNYDVPQTMLYFNFLGDVMYSWPKQKNVDSNIYNAFKFNENINMIDNFN
jgi:hypothetical protein